MLHGHLGQQSHCSTPLLPYNASRMCSPEFVVLKSVSRMHTVDRFSASPEQIPKDVIE